VNTKDIFIKMDAMRLSEETIDLSNQDISKLTKEEIISQIQDYESECYDEYQMLVQLKGRMYWATREANKEWCQVNKMLSSLNIPTKDATLRVFGSI
tara:strand:+ start:495 stop:785 length:291 start_codon:yes stop_codon:yes gene_type:complete